MTITLATVAVVGVVFPIALVAGSYVAIVFQSGISTVEDVMECSRTFETFLQRHDLPRNSKSLSGQPPVFCNPGSTGFAFKVPPTVVIYGAVDKAVQAQYLASLGAIQREIGTQKLRVEFYEQENWIEWESSDASAGSRGPERLLRTETLVN